MKYFCWYIYRRHELYFHSFANAMDKYLWYFLSMNRFIKQANLGMIWPDWSTKIFIKEIIECQQGSIHMSKLFIYYHQIFKWVSRNVFSVPRNRNSRIEDPNPNLSSSFSQIFGNLLFFLHSMYNTICKNFNLYCEIVIYNSNRSRCSSVRITSQSSQIHHQYWTGKCRDPNFTARIAATMSNPTEHISACKMIKKIFRQLSKAQWNKL